MRVVIVTPPDAFLTLEEVSQYLGLGDDTSFNAEVEELIAAVCGVLEPPHGKIGRSFGQRILEARLPAVDCCSVRLWFPPVIELVSVTWLDAAGTEHSASIDAFEVTDRAVLPLTERPWIGASLRREAVRIRYKAGYVDVPPQVRRAALRMVADLFHFRENVMTGNVSQVDIPASSMMLLEDLKVYY